MKRFGVVTGAAAVGALALSGCDRYAYETEPVTLSTTYGTVVCQLYMPSTVLWDEAIAHPEAMPKAEADRMCRSEGHRRVNAG
ncbi:MAG: hypothetical protein CML02_06915 [Pseudooceanicola sp.]|jgi:hypothetical protein|nr:hypothetical protein [Pseudooceanicola sp.]